MGNTYDRVNLIGLPLAVILKSAALSIHESDWSDAFTFITKDGEKVTVRNISIEQHVDIHIPQIQTSEEPELVESDLQIEDKKISLRDDHGADVLMDFSKRLVRCPYVVGVINSLPFNSHERRFIKRIRGEGLIEIVLPWTDKGYGVVVKTTGRTMPVFDCGRYCGRSDRRSADYLNWWVPKVEWELYRLFSRLKQG